MIAKENLNPPREKTAAASPPAERAGESVKAAAAASAGTAASGVAPDGRAPSANSARPAYVPTRRRSRRNRLL